MPASEMRQCVWCGVAQDTEYMLNNKPLVTGSPQLRNRAPWDVPVARLGNTLGRTQKLEPTMEVSWGTMTPETGSKHQAKTPILSALNTSPHHHHCTTHTPHFSAPCNKDKPDSNPSSTTAYLCGLKQAGSCL